MEVQQKVLVVEDAKDYLELLAMALSENFRVTTAENSAAAIDFIKEESFDAALIDVRLGSENGIDLAKLLRDVDPRMAIILMTAWARNYDNYRDSAPGFDDYLIKGVDWQLLVAIIRNAIYQKRMPRPVRIRRLELFKGLLFCKEKIIKFNRFVEGAYQEGDVERLTGTWQDGKKTAWVVYNLPEHGNNKFTIGVASTIGCGLGCKFCLHKERPLVRVLDWTEIICQVLYGLDSFHAKGIFEEPRLLQPCMNFTCEGEPFMNLENVAKSISVLAAIKELDFQFIITSVGLEKWLRVFLDRYITLPNVKHYWSVNSCDPEARNNLMPSARKQDLAVLRNLYQRIAEATGEKVTASFILIPGMNDGKKDLKTIVKLFGNGRPFQVKLQAYQSPERFRVFKTATKDQLNKFKEKLLLAGIDCRVREVIGGGRYAGCGTTVSDFYPEQLSSEGEIYRSEAF